MAEEEAQAQGFVMLVVAEMVLLVSWFAIFGMTVGQRIFADLLDNLDPLRISTCQGIIILVNLVGLDLSSM